MILLAFLFLVHWPMASFDPIYPLFGVKTIL